MSNLFSRMTHPIALIILEAANGIVDCNSRLACKIIEPFDTAQGRRDGPASKGGHGEINHHTASSVAALCERLGIMFS